LTRVHRGYRGNDFAVSQILNTNPACSDVDILFFA
jgi:hypothetical protein